MDETWSDAAAWVQAIGTIAAVIGAGWIAAGESRAARRREDQARLDAIERERRSAAASRTAAWNLAIMASTQIQELNSLLRDEERRGRIRRVSPSRTLETTRNMLTAFPIQSLSDAEAMVAFSYFPGALTLAAEIYANLEEDVRAGDGDGDAETFETYARQMSALVRTTKGRLTQLGHALELRADDAHDAGQDSAPTAAAVADPGAGSNLGARARPLAPARQRAEAEQ